jgi:hypothetical protein
MKFSIATLTLAVLAAGAPGAVIINGDFEAGNAGFSTDYSYRVVSNAPNFGQYGVTTTSFAWTNFWNTLTADHTTGSGQFMIVDVGDTTSVVWRQTVAVTPGTSYSFSAWLATWTTFPATTLAVRVDGVQVGLWAAPGNAVWTPYAASFDSGARTSVEISLVPTTFFQPGADVAIDDIMIIPAPAPLALAAAGLIGVCTRRRR